MRWYPSEILILSLTSSPTSSASRASKAASARSFALNPEDFLRLLCIFYQQLTLMKLAGPLDMKLSRSKLVQKGNRSQFIKSSSAIALAGSRPHSWAASRKPRRAYCRLWFYLLTLGIIDIMSIMKSWRASPTNLSKIRARWLSHFCRYNHRWPLSRSHTGFNETEDNFVLPPRENMYEKHNEPNNGSDYGTISLWQYFVFRPRHSEHMQWHSFWEQNSASLRWN